MKYKYGTKWLEIIDSTNSQAHRELDNLDNLSVLAAGFQTAGRGQRGNKWLSKAWENLTFSMVIKPDTYHIAASKQFIISEIATLAVSSYLDSREISCKIKWPNDIYVRDKKICGMLIENSLSGPEVASSIIGIGLNVNQTEFDPQLMNPTSMKKLTGQTYDVKTELPYIIERICQYIDVLSGEEGETEIDRLYQSRLYRLDELHEYRNYLEDSTFKGYIRKVDNDGRVVVETIEGKELRFAFKELGYII